MEPSTDTGSKTAEQQTLCLLVLPSLAITKSGEHDRHPGTLSLSAETLMAVLRDIAASVSRAGVERLCLLNGHGGNIATVMTAFSEIHADRSLQSDGRDNTTSPACVKEDRNATLHH